jgi:hypothetical protein
MSAKKKLSEIELKIKNYQKPEINHAFQKSVSYSQFSMWASCPHKWYLTYVENKQPYQASIHTVFGTAFHETIQDYITVMYNESGAAADRMDLIGLFQSKFSEVYAKEYKAAGAHFTNAEEMGNFFEDATAILNFIKKNRNKLFTIRKMRLLGIEIPLLLNVANNVFLKGFIDFVLYDEELDKVYIYDIKTSTRGWSDYEKKDDNKIAQILLYKEYFSKQFGFDVEKIEVEYFIVKRKIWEQSEYPTPRTQSFKPASGKNKRKQAVENFHSFIKDCFDEVGKPQLKSYLKNVGEGSCKWCPYKDSPELCDKVASSV